MNVLPKTYSDRFALNITLGLRFLADLFFAKRYAQRTLMLETVAGVPGMVAGMWNHLRSLRRMEPDKRGWIKTLLEEAENERMHLMIFIEITKPSWFERCLVAFTQFVFWHLYFILYVFFPATAHRMVGYFEEQAVISYTDYIALVKADQSLNIEIPRIAKDYYSLSDTSRLIDLLYKIREDEQGHCITNHEFSNQLHKVPIAQPGRALD